MPIVFGRVPHPSFDDDLIPDSSTRAFNHLGQRAGIGVVYHRQQGASNQGTGNWFRTLPPGGKDFCPDDRRDANFFTWGGCRGLTDYGVDQFTGAILRWNDPLGGEHQGVTANRAGWASGPVSAAAYGDGRAYLLDNGWDPNAEDHPALAVVNRDQVSIEIAGFFDDPISDACKDSVAALSAHFADRAGIPWESYPFVPGKGYSFVRWHEEFLGEQTPRYCPGRVVMDQTNDIVERTKQILKHFQTGGAAAEDFVLFETPRQFHVPANARANGRREPNRNAETIRVFEAGTAISCDGFFHGETVAGEDRWLRMSDPEHLAIHASGVAERI